MASTDEHLRRWTGAGVIDAAIADRIRRFEAAQVPARPRADRPGVLEALIYLGVVVAGVGAVFLVGQNWDELESWARLSAVAVPGGLALLAGWALQASDEPPLQRAGHVAWLAAVALITGTVLVAGRELSDNDLASNQNRDVLLVAGVTSVALSLTLWVVVPTHPQVVALVGSVVFLAQTIGNWPDEFSPQLAGMVVFGAGVAGLALALFSRLQPGVSATPLFGALAAAGPYEAGLDGDVQWAELMVFAVGAGLVALSVWRGDFSLTVVGVVAIFVGLITYMFEHFEDEVGAPVALMVSGGALVAGVLLLVQLRAMMRHRGAP